MGSKLQTYRLWITSHWTGFLIVLSVAFFITNVIAFYPGYMSADSLTQLGQALGINPVGDWHPPVMMLLWRGLINATSLVSAMLIAQVFLLWLSLSILSLAIFKKTKSRQKSLLPVIIGVSPIVFCISGVIWKDVQMAYSLTLASSLLIALRLGIVKSAVWSWAMRIVCFILIIYAGLLRYNALAAIIPILFLLADEAYPNSHALIKIVSSIAVSILAVAVIGTIVNSMVGAKAENPISSVMLDDVINIRSGSELNSKGGALFSDILAVQSACADKHIIMNSYWLCANNGIRESVHDVHYKELRSYWVRSILRHPLRYLAYKIETFSAFLVATEQSVEQYGIDANLYHQEVLSKKIQYTMYLYTIRFWYEHFSFIFQPWFWLLAGLFTLRFSAKKLKKFKVFAVCLSLSSTLYILSYAPVVVAVEYRYIYWSVIGLLLTWIAIVIEYNHWGSGMLSVIQRTSRKMTAAK